MRQAQSSDTVRIPCEYCRATILLNQWAIHNVIHLFEDLFIHLHLCLLGGMSRKRRASTGTTSSVSRHHRSLGDIWSIFLEKSLDNRWVKGSLVNFVNEHSLRQIFIHIRCVSSLDDILLHVLRRSIVKKILRIDQWEGDKEERC